MVGRLPLEAEEQPDGPVTAPGPRAHLTPDGSSLGGSGVLPAGASGGRGRQGEVGSQEGEDQTPREVEGLCSVIGSEGPWQAEASWPSPSGAWWDLWSSSSGRAGAALCNGYSERHRENSRSQCWSPSEDACVADERRVLPVLPWAPQELEDTLHVLLGRPAYRSKNSNPLSLSTCRSQGMRWEAGEGALLCAKCI